MIPKLHPALFEWTIWRNGTPIDLFGVPFRQSYLPSLKPLVLRYAIGYCNGSELVVRPKLGCKAVMFFKDEQYFWWHLYDNEFDFIFGLTSS